MQFLVFAASHRPESHNKKLAQQATTQLEARGHQVRFLQYEQLDMPIYNDHLAQTQLPPAEASRLLDQIEDCHGLIIASPEYNWSIPGSLKNIIDWTSKINILGLKDKTALLLAASPSNRGGIVGLTHLRSPLEALQMHVYQKVFALEHSHVGFNESGNLANESRQQQLNSIIDDYVSFTHKLSNTSS